MPLLLDVNGQIQPSLAIETLTGRPGRVNFNGQISNRLRQQHCGQEHRSQGGQGWRWSFRFRPMGNFGCGSESPILAVRSGLEKFLQNGADLPDLAGKMIFIGASASMLNDIVATPLDPSTPGVEAHAQLVEQILSGVTLQRPDWEKPGAELVAEQPRSLLLGAFLPFVGVFWTALLGIVKPPCWPMSWTTFTRHGVLLDPVAPSLSSGLVFLAGVERNGQKRQQVNEIRSAFSRFVSPAVARASGRAS